MLLNKIITLINKNVRLQFLAMERSLRATGCNLPIWAIPYDENTFELPENSVWWEIPELTKWLKEVGGNNRMRKYQCFTVANYHFVDPDIIFLKNPELVLKPFSGFITSDGHWHSPHGQVYTEESIKFLQSKSTTWQKECFNSGQFACDRVLYTIDDLKHTCMRDDFKNICIHFKKRDQFAMNLLVSYSCVPVYNLQLPPVCMESTWAGDYYDEKYERYWQEENRKPYLIHWAGMPFNKSRPIDKLYLDFFSKEEEIKWKEYVKLKYNKTELKYGFFQTVASKVKKIYTSLSLK